MPTESTHARHRHPARIGRRIPPKINFLFIGLAVLVAVVFWLHRPDRVADFETMLVAGLVLTLVGFGLKKPR